MKSALAIQCLPLSAPDKGKAYALVDQAIAEIEASRLPYTVGPFETVVEGELDTLWKLAQKAHKAVLDGGGRVATYIKLFCGPVLGSSEEMIGMFRDRGL